MYPVRHIHQISRSQSQEIYIKRKFGKALYLEHEQPIGVPVFIIVVNFRTNLGMFPKVFSLSEQYIADTESDMVFTSQRTSKTFTWTMYHGDVNWSKLVSRPHCLLCLLPFLFGNHFLKPLYFNFRCVCCTLIKLSVMRISFSERKVGIITHGFMVVQRHIPQCSSNILNK